MDTIKSWLNTTSKYLLELTCAPLVVILAVVFTVCTLCVVVLGIIAIGFIAIIEPVYKLFARH